MRGAPFWTVPLLAAALTGAAAEEVWTGAPIQARFEAAEPPRLGESVPVTLVVAPGESAEPLPIGEDAWADLQVRLPSALGLEGEGWRPADSLTDESDDPGGPWLLFEWSGPVGAVGRAGGPLLKVPLSLTVAEPGSNWVITCRARLVDGEKSWEGYGILFATVDEKSSRFHTTPEFPWLQGTDAQAD